MTYIYFYGFKYKNVYFINKSYDNYTKNSLFNLKTLMNEWNRFTKNYSLNETKLKLDDILNSVNDIKPHKNI
jgi:fructosamine-3-kinase